MDVSVPGRRQARRHDRFLSVPHPQCQGGHALSRQGPKRMTATPLSETIFWPVTVRSQLPPRSAARSTATEPDFIAATMPASHKFGAPRPGISAVVMTMSICGASWRNLASCFSRKSGGLAACRRAVLLAASCSRHPKWHPRRNGFARLRGSSHAGVNSCSNGARSPCAVAQDPVATQNKRDCLAINRSAPAKSGRKVAGLTRLLFNFYALENNWRSNGGEPSWGDTEHPPG